MAIKMTVEPIAQLEIASLYSENLGNWNQTDLVEKNWTAKETCFLFLVAEFCVVWELHIKSYFF